MQHRMSVRGMSLSGAPGNFRVRAARQQDLRSVSQVATEGWRHVYRRLLSQDAINDALANWYSPEAMRRRLTVGGLEVAELQQRVVGFVQHASVSAGIHDVFAIYVLPTFLGKGAGWAMWRRVHEAATTSDSSSIELWVLKGNKLGIDWYDRQGGIVVGQRRVDFLDEPQVELRYRFTARR